MTDNSWERETISKMLEMTVKEQRAKRRWSIFFKSIVVVYVLFITFAFFAKEDDLTASVSGKEFTAVVPLTGEIFANKDAGADNVIPLLRKAFKTSHAKAIILRINSPGGSPTQANQIYQEMVRLREKYPKKKLYAVIEDVGASAAYWIACGADQIYVDQSSLVGSIGVAMSTFGFVDGMHKLGIERRLYVSGDNKDFLDPFSPVKPNQVAMLQEDLNTLHAMFIKLVKDSRGDRLQETPDMFSGRIWIGVNAKQLGLVDGLGDQYSVARDVVEAPELVEFQVKKSLFSQFNDTIGGSFKQLGSKLLDSKLF